MNQKCIFCEINNGNIPCIKLYEDDSVIAIADAFPCRDGHFLVMPKKHVENMFDIDEDTLYKVYSVVKKICTAYKSFDESVSLNIVQNNGKSCGQEVFHFHVHIIPVYENEKKVITVQTKTLDKDKTNSIIKELKKNL